MNKEEKTKEREPFFIVPSRVFDLELSPYELCVLFYLMMRADNEKHTCFPSEKGIAKACGMGISTVKKMLKNLEDKKVLSKEKQFQKSQNGLNRQTANLYTVQLFDIPPAVSRCTPPSHQIDGK